MRNRALSSSLFVVLIVSLGIVVLKAAPNPIAAPQNQAEAAATLTLLDNTEHVKTSTQENFSSNFEYFYNQNFPISINVSAESLEGEVVKRWDTYLSGNSSNDTFEQFFSLHPAISGSTSFEQALTFKIKVNSLFSKASASQLQELFDSVTMLDSCINSQTSDAVITLIDPLGNKINFAAFKMSNGLSLVTLSRNSNNIWQVLRGKNASESMMENAAKKFKGTGQGLYNEFH